MAENSERLIFEGDYTYENINLPGFRHWYYLNSNRYLGSDIIVELRFIERSANYLERTAKQEATAPNKLTSS